MSHHLVELQPNGRAHISSKMLVVPETAVEFMLPVVVGLALILCQHVCLEHVISLHPTVRKIGQK